MNPQPHDSDHRLTALSPLTERPERRLPSWARWSALTLSLVVCGLLASGCTEKPPEAGKTPASATREPTKVGVITMRAETQTLTSALPGRTSAFMSADIRPQINGIVQKRLFTEGATVKVGQPLYQIDAAPYQATEAAARAALAKAQAQARTAEVNATRNAELVRIDAISRQVYDESLAAAQQTASDVAVAQAALTTARINVGYTRIVAPISGRTTLSNVNPGGLVTANQVGVLTTISQLDPMYVDVTQSSSELLQLKRDLAAGRFERLGAGTVRITILLEDGKAYPHPGRLQFSGVNVNPSTGAVTLRAVVPNPDGVLMPGMYVQTLLPTGQSSDALLVPQQAVTRDIAGKANVMVVGPNNQVARRAIEVERAIGSRWLVSSGLAVGDTVVVDGFQRIKPGDTVAPQAVQLPSSGSAAPATAPRASNPGETPKTAAGAPATPASAPAR